jgi:uncharacterized protein involved in exopolysaccharide biosynthesis
MEEVNIDDLNKSNDYDYNAISLKSLIEILFQNKFLIIFTTTLVSIFSILYSLSIPNVYKSEVLVDVRSSSQANNILSQYSGVASLAGIKIPSGSEDKTSLAIEMIKSRDFFNHISRKHNLLPLIMAPSFYDLESKELIYDKEFYDNKNNKWLKNIPSFQEAHLKFLKTIKIEKSKDSSFLNISYSHISPFVSKKIIDIIILEINLISKERDLLEINNSLDYLSDQLLQNETLEIRNSINNLIEAELKKKMVNRINEDYLLMIIDSSYVPNKKFSPHRSAIVIFYTFFGILLSFFIVILKFNFVDKKRLD